jgi:hypothetical protein
MVDDVEKTSSSPQRVHRIRKRSNHVTIVRDIRKITHKQIIKMGQRPIEIDLVSEDGTQTGMVEMI